MHEGGIRRGKSTKKINNHVLVEESSRGPLCEEALSTCILGATGHRVLNPVGSE